MRAKGKSNAERLKRETERILYDCRHEIRQMDLTESVARRNIREFLKHLSQFHDQGAKNHTTVSNLRRKTGGSH
jgi:hypothetical protein